MRHPPPPYRPDRDGLRLPEQGREHAEERIEKLAGDFCGRCLACRIWST